MLARPRLAIAMGTCSVENRFRSFGRSLTSRSERIGRENQVHHQLMEITAWTHWVQESISAELVEVVVSGCDGPAQGHDCPPRV